MVYHRLSLLFLFYAAVAFLYPSEAIPTFQRVGSRKTAQMPSLTRFTVNLSMRGGGFSLLGWTVPASHLARFYVGFTGLNGAVMAVVPTIAEQSYGSAFDDSKESLIATLLLEQQGDAVLGTSLLLHLSTFTSMPLEQSVAWSTVPYVLSLLKGLATGQLTFLGFDPKIASVMLLSILLPTLSIVIPNGWNPKVPTNILATILMLHGASGSLDPARTASMQGLDMAGGPAWIQACWLLASLCTLQHGILTWSMIISGDANDTNTFGTVSFAALLSAVVAAYVALISNIPQAAEIPRIGFVVWMIIGLAVGWGIRN